MQLQKKQKQISRKDNIINKRNKVEWKLITNIKNKMAMKKFTITEADKEKPKFSFTRRILQTQNK
jgi:hypothetical protein